ncbi:IclR family transcriptional regulator [Agromyces protaetiae]|uniref:Glycerol operon regulatory protein n=1 Tax=Agromyces protaetiae TaxID=2509455 RepID=A0A4P6F8X3_9MICO|nr:IclR family transcriptional regulator [Agromyces protaetiae]QAY72015.1 IclR family transcriptional regulator [Agromyces protaetiae]
MPSERGNNQSVEKAVAVLNVFAGGQPQRVSDVAKATQLGQSTASRLLSTLESVALVERDPVTGLYRLGPDVIALGSVALNQNSLYRGARQTLQNFSADFGLGANVAVRRDDSVMYLVNFDGVNAPRDHTIAGRRDPLHATSMGKCLLLGVAVAERAELLGELIAYTARTITDLDRLNAEVAEVGRRGYAVDVDEFALGRASVATPVRDPSGTVVGAISLSGPASAVRLDERETVLAAALIEAADRIGSSLGYVAAIA